MSDQSPRSPLWDLLLALFLLGLFIFAMAAGAAIAGPS